MSKTERRIPSLLTLSLGAAMLGIGLVAGGDARAVEIYRWVDDAGRTHLSDIVPEMYKPRATKLDSRRFSADEAQRAQAQAQAAKEKARAAAADAAAARDAKTRDSGSVRPAAPPARRGLSQADFDKLDCKTQQRLYRESLACFAPFIRQAPYFVPPEAFQQCDELKEPSNKCGTEVTP